MALEYVPAEGKIAVEILDELDEKKDEATGPSPSSQDSYNEALLAICVGVGPKVTACKKGDTVYLYRWAAYSGVCLGEDVKIVDATCVAARVKA